jgi:hypothetical protein
VFIVEINGILTGKFMLLLGIGCAVMVASANDAKAYRTSVPPTISLAIGDQYELGQLTHPHQRVTPMLRNMLTS